MLFCKECYYFSKVFIKSGLSLKVPLATMKIKQEMLPNLILFSLPF